MSNSYRCKGATGLPCVEEVTFTWSPVYSVVLEDTTPRPPKVGKESVYLTCVLGHTNPYVVDEKGDIVG